MRAPSTDGGGGVHLGRGVQASSGSPPPPPGPPPGPIGAAPPGVAPPRPLGIHRSGTEVASDRSRAVKFEAALIKIRARSSDDALLAQMRLGKEYDEEKEAKPHNNMHVAVRTRWLLEKEASVGGRAILKVLDNNHTVVLEDPHTTAADDYLRINKSKERRYTFDEALDEYTSQQEVFDRTTKALIGGLLEGFNATVFAYGATSAGKTHTMLGTPTMPGIMMLTLLDLFSKVAVQREDRVFEVKCSFLEVYNENIRDLLRPEGDYLDIREDPVKGMCVAGISEVGGLESANEIMILLHQANRHRTTESTGANDVSSRSHAVLQVVVEQRDRASGFVAQVNVGKLSMIDLAGSERASQTNNRGQRMIEGANINRSLLALGNCITALSSGVSFVPYRDSKMTRLLKDSLGGNCSTVMIANVSPCHLNYEDTHNTLKYASRARNIKTRATRNTVSVSYHLSKYTEIIKELRGEIADLKTKLATDPAPDILQEAEAFMSKMEQEDGVEDGKGLLDQTQITGVGESSSTAAPDESELEAAHVQSTKWKQELMTNFEERVRIKRQLIDLAHVAQNQMVQKSRAQVGISQWESTQVNSQVPARAYTSESGPLAVGNPEASSPVPAADMPQSIRDLQDQMQLIRTEMANTEENTRGLEQQLVENLKVSERLQVELPTRVPNKDMRAFLGLVYRIYVLEVENIDLQEMNDVTQPLLQQKELEAEALRLQIRMRDKMIDEQDRMLVLGSEMVPAKPAGWQEIKGTLISGMEEIPAEESPQRGQAPGWNQLQAPKVVRGRRTRSAGPQERIGINAIQLPPISPSASRFHSGAEGSERPSPPHAGILNRGAHERRPPDTSRASPHGAASPDHGGGSMSSAAPPETTTASELPPLDIAGRGLGIALPLRTAEEPQANREGPLNDDTRKLPHGSLSPSAEGLGIEGVGRGPPNTSSAAGAQENRTRPSKGDHVRQRKRKNRREREAAREKHRERLQQQLHIEAASLQQRYDVQQAYGVQGRGRDQTRSPWEDLPLATDRDDRGSSSDNKTPTRRGRGGTKAIHEDPPPAKDPPTAAGRRVALEKLNGRMKPKPKQLS